MTWSSILIAGIVTYFTRMTMVVFFKKNSINENLKKVLTYVPSAVFPVIIFPAVFLNDYGNLENITHPKILGAIFAALVGYFSQNVIVTIVSGLTFYWLLIFI